MHEKLKGVFPGIPPVANGQELPDRPFLSVVVPVRHDRCQFLGRALSSVVSQWRDDMELVVVHAMATEPYRLAVAEVVNDHGDGKVRLAQYEDDLDCHSNWNRAVSHARGQYVHFLHDDDYVLPGFYQAVRDKVHAAGAVAISVGYENVNDDGQIIYSSPDFQTDESGRLPLLYWRNLLLRGNPLNPPGVVLHRSVYETLGGYAPRTVFCDWEFYIRVSRFFYWHHVPEKLARYRQHDLPSKLVYVKGTKQVLDTAALYIDAGEINAAKALQYDQLVGSSQ
ncbi:MAG: glycosyltransferase [Acidobacteriota bacterium]|jgi:glycosyltransferase involved in cell wall biosynthesis|nr:glycosyltransferase [Acidobacteriota bacterium]